MSKFLALGLSLEESIARVTRNPAQVFGALNGFGSLREGSEADIAVFQLETGRYDFVDALGAHRSGERLLRPAATVKAGRLYGAASTPVERL